MTVPLVGPTLTVTNTIQFKYPYDSPYTLELTLPRQKTQDDIWRFAFNRAYNTTRNNEVKLYRDPNWPEEHTLLWTLTELTYAQLTDLRAFLDTTLGRTIKVIDWYSNVWEAIIINTTDEQVEDADNTNCGQRYTVPIQLMAELKSWP